VPSGFPGFPPEMVQFFRSLKRNNRRDWFQPRKHVFDEHVKAPMVELVNVLNRDLAKFAPDYVTDPKKALFRIYRDTRFSADKTPYKTHIAASFWRRGADHTGAGGYYFSVAHDRIEVAGGIWHPSPETMYLVRSHIAENHPEMRRILANKKSRKLAGDLQGEELSRAPKGFDTGHPALDLIKKKDWILDTTVDPSLAITPKLYKEVLDRFRVIAPLIEFLNRPLIGRKPPREPLEGPF
jgi:uncharacterized protein (TIGR02453 family)